MQVMEKRREFCTIQQSHYNVQKKKKAVSVFIECTVAEYSENTVAEKSIIQLYCSVNEHRGES